MFDVVREHDAAIVLMHMKGEPKTMQESPEYEDVVGEVHEYLRERIEAAEFAGIDAERIAIDPGIGFGKNLGAQPRADAPDRRPSSTSAGRSWSAHRASGSSARSSTCPRTNGSRARSARWRGWSSRGAHVVRVHDVREVVRAVRVVDAIVRAGR